MTLLIGKRYRDKLSKSLAAQGIDVFWLPDNPAVDGRLSGHADLSVFVSGKKAVIAPRIAVSSDIVKFLTNRGHEVLTAHEQGEKYPQDAGLCLCDTGEYILYNPKTADPTAVTVSGSRPVHVSQGYTKCAACIINEHSIITSDASVSRAAKIAGMDVLEITPGFIQLDGFDYGFIGGASFKLNNNVIAFTGMLDKHPDKERILQFIAERGLEPVYLTDGPIFDIGGAIPV